MTPQPLPRARAVITDREEPHPMDHDSTDVDQAAENPAQDAAGQADTGEATTQRRDEALPGPTATEQLGDSDTVAGEHAGETDTPQESTDTGDHIDPNAPDPTPDEVSPTHPDFVAPHQGATRVPEDG